MPQADSALSTRHDSPGIEAAVQAVMAKTLVPLGAVTPAVSVAVEAYLAAVGFKYVPGSGWVR